MCILVVMVIILGLFPVLKEAYLGQPVKNAVITVPAYFNDSQRQVITQQKCKFKGVCVPASCMFAGHTIPVKKCTVINVQISVVTLQTAQIQFIQSTHLTVC